MTSLRFPSSLRFPIEDSQIVRLERTAMDLKSSLEDTLVAHPEMLQPNLKDRSPNTCR